MMMAASGLKLILLSPDTLIILAIIGTLLHNRRYGFQISIMSLLLLLCLSLPSVVNYWARLWESVPILSKEQAKTFKPQALIVIGGGFDRNGDEYEQPLALNVGSLLRIRYAAKLSWELGLPILVSGGGLPATRAPNNLSEAQLMADALEREFKTPVAWIETKSNNTAENAQLSHKLLADLNIERIVLVTQAYHMPRAEEAFRNAGFQVLPAPTAFIGHQGQSSWTDWIPSPQAQINSFLLAYELIAKLWYDVRSR